MNGFIHIFTDIAGDAIEAAHGQAAAMEKVAACRPMPRAAEAEISARKMDCLKGKFLPCVLQAVIVADRPSLHEKRLP